MSSTTEHVEVIEGGSAASPSVPIQPPPDSRSPTWAYLMRGLPPWLGLLVALVIFFTPLGRGLVGLPDLGEQAASEQQTSRESESLRGEVVALSATVVSLRSELATLRAEATRRDERAAKELEALRGELREQRRELLEELRSRRRSP